MFCESLKKMNVIRLEIDLNFSLLAGMYSRMLRMSGLFGRLAKSHLQQESIIKRYFLLISRLIHLKSFALLTIKQNKQISSHVHKQQR